MSFKVGDEVYVKMRINEVEQNGDVWVIFHSSNICLRKGEAIPASRVTVAPARRKAEFPKDWGKPATAISMSGIEYDCKIVGKDGENIVVYCDGHYDTYSNVEVVE